MSFSYTISREDNLMIVSLEGNLIGKPQVAELMDEISDELSNGDRNILIDMENMQYMNSTGLNILINILTQTRSKGGEVIIANVPEKINKLLVITKLNSVFNIKDNIEQAKTELATNES